MNISFPENSPQSVSDTASERNLQRSFEDRFNATKNSAACSSSLNSTEKADPGLKIDERAPVYITTAASPDAQVDDATYQPNFPITELNQDPGYGISTSTAGQPEVQLQSIDHTSSSALIDMNKMDSKSEAHCVLKEDIRETLGQGSADFHERIFSGLKTATHAEKEKDRFSENEKFPLYLEKPSLSFWEKFFENPGQLQNFTEDYYSHSPSRNYKHKNAKKNGGTKHTAVRSSAVQDDDHENRCKLIENINFYERNTASNHHDIQTSSYFDKSSAALSCANFNNCNDLNLAIGYSRSERTSLTPPRQKQGLITLGADNDCKNTFEARDLLPVEDCLKIQKLPLPELSYNHSRNTLHREDSEQMDNVLTFGLTDNQIVHSRDSKSHRSQCTPKNINTKESGAEESEMVTQTSKHGHFHPRNVTYSNHGSEKIIIKENQKSQQPVNQLQGTLSLDLELSQSKAASGLKRGQKQGPQRSQALCQTNQLQMKSTTNRMTLNSQIRSIGPPYEYTPRSALTSGISPIQSEKLLSSSRNSQKSNRNATKEAKVTELTTAFADTVSPCRRSLSPVFHHLEQSRNNKLESVITRKRKRESEHGYPSNSVATSDLLDDEGYLSRLIPSIYNKSLPETSSLTDRRRKRAKQTESSVICPSTEAENSEYDTITQLEAKRIEQEQEDAWKEAASYFRKVFGICSNEDDKPKDVSSLRSSPKVRDDNTLASNLHFRTTNVPEPLLKTPEILTIRRASPPQQAYYGRIKDKENSPEGYRAKLHHGFESATSNGHILRLSKDKRTVPIEVVRNGEPLESAYTCNICQEHFGDLQAVQNHKLMRHRNEGKPRIKCPHCPKTMISQANVIRHVNICHASDQFKCPHCPVSFATARSLTEHFRDDHRIHRNIKGQPLSVKQSTENQLVYPCKVCERTFKTKRNLIRHFDAVHRNIKSFKCPLCEKCFSTRSNMQVHMTIHEKDACFSD